MKDKICLRLLNCMLCMGLCLMVWMSGYWEDNNIQSEEKTGEIRKAENAAEIETAEMAPENTAAERAVLTPDACELELKGKLLSYGQIQMECPSEITLEEWESEREGITVDLAGAEKWYEDNSSPIPPRIRFMHYRAQYDSEMALVSALLDLLPEAQMRIGYWDDAHLEYGYSMENDDYQDYIFVKGEDVYCIEVMEDYIFRYLLCEKGMVRWADSGEKILFDQLGQNDFDVGLRYMKISPEDGFAFLCRSENTRIDGKKKTNLYQEGYYDKSCLFIYGFVAYRDNVLDLNFDGCEDLATTYNRRYRYYIWNTETRQYERESIKFQLPRAELFPETGTIWSYDTEGTTESTIYTETLWQWGKDEWNESVLTEKRVCKEIMTEDDVELTAYEGIPEKTLFDESFSREEWENHDARVQAFYEEFYEGYVPVQVFDIRHAGWQENNQYVPRELVDRMSDFVLNGTRSEDLRFLPDNKLSTEEIVEIAKTSRDIRSEVIAASYEDNYYLMIKVDADNDGTDDIISQSYYGADSGYADYIFLKGQPDGTYTETDRFSGVQQEFAVINYAGKNYLTQTSYHYSKKIYNGMTICCYENGTLMEKVNLRLVPKAYHPQLAVCEKAYYRPLAEKVMADSGSAKEAVDSYVMLTGSAEKRNPEGEDWEYSCDLDHDGVEERYNKHLWDSANIYYKEQLELDGEEEETLSLLREAISGNQYGNANLPVMFWVDDYEGENIINIMYRTGLDDYDIAGCLLKESGYETLYRITVDVTYEVAVE